jgi:hypothetical protein
MSKTRFAVPIGAALLLLGACTIPDPSGESLQVPVGTCGARWSG